MRWEMQEGTRQRKRTSHFTVSQWASSDCDIGTAKNTGHEYSAATDQNTFMNRLAEVEPGPVKR